MAESFTIQIEGLRELRKALRTLSKELPKDLKKIMQDAAQRGVRRAQRSHTSFYPRPGSSRRGTGRTAAKGIRVSATQTGAGIRFGGARYAYLLGQEFGSNKHRQFSPWTGPGPGGAGSSGRFVYPAARAEADAAVRDVLQGFDVLARRAFPGR